MQKTENSILTENKILIVDDTAIDLKLLTKILHEEGLKVTQAKSGLEALASISKDPPNLILMDIRMPEMDGFEVCTQLKNNPATREIPIIFLSSISDKNVIAKGFQLGGADYITKPIIKEEVLARVATQLKMLEMQIELQTQNQNLLNEIGERYQIEGILLESEKRFKLLFDNAPLSYQSLDKNACLIEVNPTWLKTLGYQKEEVVGRYFGEFMTPESEKNIKLRFGKFIADGEIHDYRFEMVRKDGSHFMVSYEGRIGKDEAGNFKQTHCVFTDITNKLSAEKAIRDSELKFRTIFENANEGICGADKNLIITYANQKMADLTGYTIDELIGMNYLNIILPEDHTEVYKIEEERNEGKFGTYERCLHTKNKQIVWTLVSSSPLFSDERIYMGSVGMFTDITERKKAQEDLKESEEIYRNLIDNMPDGVYKSTHDGKFLEVNQSMVNILGYDSKQELMEVDIKKELYFEATDRDSLTLEELNEELGTFRMRKKDGSEIWVEDHGWYTLDSDGNVLFHEGIMRDVTERRQIELKLDQAAKNWHKTFESIHDAIVLLDENQNIVIGNEAFLKLTGEEMATITAHHCFGFVHNSKCPGLNCPFIRSKTSKLRETEEMIIGGSMYQMIIDPILNEKKELTGAVHILRDITIQKQTEKALQESELMYRNLILKMPDGVYKTTHDGNIIELNPAMIKILGYDNIEELKKLNISKDLYFNAIEREEKTVEGLSNDLISYRMRRRDGSEVWVEDHGWYTYNEKNEIITHEGVIRDITQRRIQEAQIKTLSKAIEQSPISIIITNAEGLIEFVNNEFISFTQYSFEEVKGKKPRIFNPGHLLVQDFNEMWETLKNGNTWKGEFSNRKKDESLFTEEVTISTMQDIDGKISHYILIMEDITERKLILDDLVIAKEKAEESDQLKTAFLHNISHEIRTPMNAIVGFSGIINQPDIHVEDRQKYTDIIVNSSNQLLSIITDIVSMATIEAGQEKAYTKVVNLNTIGRRVYDQFSITAQKRDIDLRFIPDLSDQDAAFVTDEIKLVQVLTNLVGNALKFTFEGFVEFGYTILNDQIKFHIKDSGIGIAPELHQEIFKRFRQVETTSVRQFGGSGLGLSISKAYIDLLGGEIWIESAPEKGTTFFFTFPYEKQIQQISSTVEKNTGIQIKQKTTILIAEDEDSNFVLLEVILASTSLSIIRVKTGFEAVDRCKTNPAISLVLMDIKMPGMDGYEATKKIKTMLPDLPVIALTAFSTEADKNKAFASGCSDFISKPFKRDKLLSIINKHLKNNQ